MVKIYKQPFAHYGDAIAIPDASQPDGKMSGADGWTPDYQLPKTDPNYKPVGRQEMNGVFKEVTEALGQVQVQGSATWSAAGAPYPVNAQVYHNGKQWLALRANSVEPTEGADWTDRIGDVTLRQDLANPDMGAAMVARGVVAVDSIADLLALPEEQRKEGLRYLVKGYHAGSDIGGGEFYWDSARVSENDGGIVLEGFVRLEASRVNPTWFGAVPDHRDNHDAFFKALNSKPDDTRLSITVDVGVYKILGPLYLTRPTEITGSGDMENPGVTLDFAGATTGGNSSYQASILILHSLAISHPDVPVELPQGQVGISGSGSRISGVCIKNAPSIGLLINAPAKVHESKAMGCGRHGIALVANAVSGSPGEYIHEISGNANHSSISRHNAHANGASGIFIKGSDANAFNVSECIFAFNGEYGVYDGSLLGGVVSGCEALSNTLGDYVQQGSSLDNSGSVATPATTTFVGNYSEGPTDRAYSLNARTLVIGRTGHAPPVGHVNVLLPTIAGLLTYTSLSVGASAGDIYAGKGADFATLARNGLSLGSSHSANAAIRFIMTNNGRAVIRAADSDPSAVFFAQDLDSTRRADRPWFPQGIVLGPGKHYQGVALSFPTGGTWDKGNIMWNESPDPGEPVGWVCVSGGSPGTWRGFGVIDTTV